MLTEIEWRHTLPYSGIDLQYYWGGIQKASADDSLKIPDCDLAPYPFLRTS